MKIAKKKEEKLGKRLIGLCYNCSKEIYNDTDWEPVANKPFCENCLKEGMIKKKES